MRMYTALALTASLCTLCALAASAQELQLARDGAPTAIIAIPPEPDADLRAAAEDLQATIRTASGAELPIIEAADLATLPADGTQLLIGAELARQAGVEVDALDPEEYVIQTIDRRIAFTGPDGEPRTAGYAVTRFLDDELGVRWLWPGEIGTYIPRRSMITVQQIDLRGRPSLQQRKVRTGADSVPGQANCRLLTDEERAQLSAEVDRWAAHHQMGSRSTFRFGHAFRHWWETYGETHPEYFATPPEGQNPIKSDRSKLCVSNPAVAEQVIAEWKAAGSPDNWNVCPNDGSGFCTCDNCRAMDDPPNQDPEAVWRGQTNLTTRYVTFWNRLIREMRETNPNVTVSSYAYSAYRQPPQGLTIEPGIVLGVVHTYHAYDEWQAWSDAGAQLFLRPNWWHMGGPAPHIPLHAQGGYFLFARENSMVGYDMDSLIGFWGTQGPLYYTIARLGSRDDLTVDDVIAEYCSAFGSAADDVAAYLRFWEDFSDRAAYAVPAGGVVSTNPDGLYEQAARKYEMNIHPISSSWPILPALYTDDVLDEAEAILERAEAAAADDAPETQARVAFLRDGLRHLRLVRDTVALSDPRFRPEGATETDFRASADALQQMRREITPRHVVWGEVINSYEVGRRCATGLTEAGWIETEGL